MGIERIERIHRKGCSLTFISDQAAHASPWLYPQDCCSVRSPCSPSRRTQGLLHFLSDYALYDGAIYCLTVHGVRVHFQGHESASDLRSLDALCCWRPRWRLCCWPDDAARRDQNVVTDSRSGSRRGDSFRSRFVDGGGYHSASKWPPRLSPGLATKDYHGNAEYSNMLVSGRRFWLCLSDLIYLICWSG